MRVFFFILCIFLVGCNKPDNITPVAETDIFTTNQTLISNGQVIKFSLTSPGKHSLALLQKETNQVLSREQFTGKVGINTRKLYTSTLPKGSLILVLEDVNKGQLSQTLIFIN